MTSYVFKWSVSTCYVLSVQFRSVIVSSGLLRPVIFPTGLFRPVVDILFYKSCLGRLTLYIVIELIFSLGN